MMPLYKYMSLKESGYMLKEIQRGICGIQLESRALTTKTT
jgi:hypothetical protein